MKLLLSKQEIYSEVLNNLRGYFPFSFFPEQWLAEDIQREVDEFLYSTSSLYSRVEWVLGGSNKEKAVQEMRRRVCIKLYEKSSKPPWVRVC